MKWSRGLVTVLLLAGGLGWLAYRLWIGIKGDLTQKLILLPTPAEAKPAPPVENLGGAERPPAATPRPRGRPRRASAEEAAPAPRPPADQGEVEKPQGKRRRGGNRRTRGSP
jgi:hypothetical protein